VSCGVEFLLSTQRIKKQRGAYQITLTQSHAQDWTRLWPHEEGVHPSFRLVTLPVRLLSLALLWTTSTPGRLLLGIGLVAVVAIAIIVR
jgi:hypothetical protein